jgi:hypothetical protein
MRTEHKRPLVAFIVVALFCSFTVGNAVRGAIVGNGFGLTILLPWAPPGLVRTITSSGFNGLYPDSNPFLGTAIGAVSDVSAPPAPGQAPTAPEVGSSVVPAIATPSATSPTSPTVRQPTQRPGENHQTGAVHHPRSHNIGEPPAPSTGPTTLAAARTDLRAARDYANKARQAAKGATFDARWCVGNKGRAACQDLLVAAQTARIRADEAGSTVGHLDAVVDHIINAISTVVGPVREKASQTFTIRLARAQERFVDARGDVRSESQVFQQANQDQWADALATYARAVGKAGRAAHAASDQRLRQVRAYAEDRQATVKHIKRVYEQKIRAGHVAAARTYRKSALADLAKQDRIFDNRIVAARARAAAAYETAVGVAKEALDRTRDETAQAKLAHDAEVADALAKAKDAYTTKVQAAAEVRAETVAAAQAEAEATVVVDPATVPPGPNP